jgi:hypothetical protein
MVSVGISRADAGMPLDLGLVASHTLGSPILQLKNGLSYDTFITISEIP